MVEVDGTGTLWPTNQVLTFKVCSEIYEHVVDANRVMGGGFQSLSIAYYCFDIIHPPRCNCYSFGLVIVIAERNGSIGS